MSRLKQPPRLAERWRAAVGDYVNALAWSPDGRVLAAAAVSGPVTLLDADTGRALHTLPGHGFGTAALGWRPRGGVLASAGQDGKVRLWDSGTGAELRALDGGAAWVECLAWSPRGDYLATAAGRKLRLWGADGEPLRAYPDQAHTVADLCWAPKGRELIAGGYGGVSFWSPDADEPLRRFERKSSLLALALSPDGKFLAAGTQDGTVYLWPAKNDKGLEMSGYSQKVRELAWDATSRRLATGGGPLVIVWDCAGKGPAGREPLGFEGHEQPVTALAFQHRGGWLASTATDGRLLIWQPGTFQRSLGEARIEEGLVRVVWSPSDGRLAVGGEAGTVAVFGV